MGTINMNMFYRYMFLCGTLVVPHLNIVAMDLSSSSSCDGFFTETVKVDYCVANCGCFSEKNGRKLINLSCGHSVCAKCWFDQNNLKCPAKECSYKISNELYNNFKQGFYFKPRNDFYCTSLCTYDCLTQRVHDCESYDSQNDRGKHMQLSCGHKICVPCAHWHPVKTYMGEDCPWYCAYYTKRNELLKKSALAAIGLAGFGYTAYTSIKQAVYRIFNSIEYSADEIVKAFISEEPYWDFDLYSRPVTMFELRDQYDITSIVNSAASDELKQKLETAINNFDVALRAVWSVLEQGYYRKGKATFMRDKKDLVQNLQQSAQTLKDILAACRAQVSVWKKALGITALGALGVGAWLYNVGG